VGKALTRWLSVKARVLRGIIRRRFSVGLTTEAAVVKSFHRVYHGAARRTWLNTYWLGIPIQKCPLDLWVYQEIIFGLRPDLIIECGTASGGSALYMASMLDIIGVGEVITIDLQDATGKPEHRRVKYLVGSTTSEEVVASVGKVVDGKQTVMVILDSDHHKEHVLNELRTYSRFVTKGSYLIVEDTVIGHPVMRDFGDGPMEAVGQFLEENADFAVDKTKEKFYLSFNPGGYLVRTK
jgi:cephalosporin hydroxylase